MEGKKLRPSGYGSNSNGPKSVSTRDGGSDDKVIGEGLTQDQ